MRWFATLAALLLSLSVAQAKPLTASDVRQLLAVGGVNPGTVRMVPDKGRYELTRVNVTGHHGKFAIHIRVKKLPERQFVMAAMSPQNEVAIPVDLSVIMRILEIAIFVGTVLFAGSRFLAKLAVVELAVRELQKGQEAISHVITQHAVAQQRMDNLETRLDDVVTGRIRFSRNGTGHGRRKFSDRV